MPELEENQAENLSETQKKTKRNSKSFFNKIIIRKLPPNLSSNQFLEQLSPLPEINDFYFCKPDWSGGEATSRAYIEFKEEEDIFIFRDKFDGYVFIDEKTGMEYPAVVEYAAFQGLPKSRGRKKDKNAGTIDNEQHFIDFLETLKKLEEAENQKSEILKPEFSYKIKDEQKITSTPLLEFLHAKQQEKRDAQRKKKEEKRKSRDEQKQKKKEKVAQKIPEPIKESKDEAYDDGISVRAVPSRLGRNDNNKKKEKEKSESNVENENSNRKKFEDKITPEEREARKKAKIEEKREKRDKKRQQQRQEKSENLHQQKAADDTEKSKKSEPVSVETKRYSALRNTKKETPAPDTDNNVAKSEDQQQLREKSKEKARREELRQAKKRENDERAQRQIRNKDRPALQIYQPRRRGGEDGKPSENLQKSSDEFSETSRKATTSGTDKCEKREKTDKKRRPRKTSHDDGNEKSKNSQHELSENMEKLQIADSPQ